MQINCSINSGQTDFVIVSKFFSIWRREEKCFKLENSLVGREGLVQEGEFFYFLMTLNFVPFFLDAVPLLPMFGNPLSL